MNESSLGPARINFVVGCGGLILTVAAALALGITFDEHGTRGDLYLFSVD